MARENARLLSFSAETENPTENAETVRDKQEKNEL